MGAGHKQTHSLQDQAHLDFGLITFLKMGWPKESRDMDYPLWTKLYMFVVRVVNPKDGTLYLVTLMSKILATYLI